MTSPSAAGDEAALDAAGEAGPAGRAAAGESATGEPPDTSAPGRHTADEPAPRRDAPDEPAPRRDVPDEPAPEAAPPAEPGVGDGVVDRSRPGTRRLRRRLLVAVLVVLAAVVVAAGWLAFRVYQAGHALLAAQDGVTAMAQRAHDRDLPGVQAALPGVRADLDAARRAVDDPLWRASTALPWAGRQLGAVRTVTIALDQVVTEAGPALDAADTVLAAQHTGGQLNLGPLLDALPQIQAAAKQVDAASQAVAGIDAAGLTPRLAAPVAALQRQLEQVSGPARSAEQIARLLPSMVGADGPRSYLLVSLNSAELRTGGGIVGAMAVLRADHGSITLVGQRSTAAFPGLATPILPLTPEETAIHTDVLGRWIQNATMTPDFPRTAQLVAARWEATTGQHLDGVIATDAVAAAQLLKATGPVTIAGGVRLQASALLRQMLHDAYLQLPYKGGDNAAADAVYAEAATAIFHAVADAQGDRLAVVAALSQAAGEGRLRIWSAHDAEERDLITSGVGGAFLTGDTGNAVGVFLDDGTEGKLDYYLTTKVSVEDMTCTGPNPTATVRLDLTYSPPANVASEPVYVTGPRKGGLPTGWLATNISVYTPVGATLGALRLDDGYVSGTAATQDGRAVQVVTSWLPPGGHATYRATVPVHGSSLTVWSTPTLTSEGMQTVTCQG